MVPVEQLIAHGGIAGAIVEGLVVVLVVGVLVAVWLRERRGATGAGNGTSTPHD